jgi:hypothetical protein
MTSVTVPAKSYVARHVATRYWKDTTTQHTSLSTALIQAAFKHVDVLKGLNPNRVYKFKIALYRADAGTLGEQVDAPYNFVYHNGIMRVVSGGDAYKVTRH